MELQSVLVREVDVGPRMRDVDEKKVEALAKSMERLGLRTPITIHQESSDQQGFDLVAGAHRLAAAKLLNWEFIDAHFWDKDDVDRQLWEIDENLMRSELTPSQQAEHLARRKELWEARSSGTNCSTGGGAPGENKGFAQETAEAMGTTRQQINRAVARAEKSSPDILEEVRGTSLDKGVVLDEIARAPMDEQRQRLRQISEERDRKKYTAQVTELPVRSDDDVVNIQFAALVNAWNRAGPEARAEFREYLDTPVMDRARH